MAQEETTTTTTSSNNENSIINNNDNNDGDSGGGGEAWGTLEELLLVCAVNRYGSNSWDSIASQLHNQRRLCFSPSHCRRKYVDLKRRFNAAGDGGGEEEEEAEKELLRMVEELRKLRVEQLKREVHQHDISIVSLQKKVKRLEEERENTNANSSNNTSSLLVKPEIEPEQPPPPLSGEPKPEPSDLRNEPNISANRTVENDVEPERSSPGRRLGGDSAEDRSVNESNSNNKAQPDPVERRASRLGESVSESKRQQQSSEVQSSASLSKKKRRRGRGIGNSSGDEVEAEEVSPANKRISVKSQPLIRFLDILRSHKHGSVFQRRLPSQETEKFRNVIHQHMDLDSVQSRLDRGIYCECHPKFYRDLLLIFTNAVLFYRKSSAEHIAARELRKVVLEEIALRTHMPKLEPVKLDPEPQHLEPVVKKPRSSTTMVVCRRRSSIQGLSESVKNKEESHAITKISSIKNSNNNTTNSGLENGREDKPKGEQHQRKVIEKEGDKGSGGTSLKKSLTRERSTLGRGTLRLSNSNSKIISKEGNKKEKLGIGNNNKEESSLGEGVEPIERKKINVDQKQEKATTVLNVDHKQEKTTTVLKKQGVANFLKRMKQNSPSSQEKAKNSGSDEEDEEEGDGAEGHHQVGRKEKMDSLSNSNGKKTGGNPGKSHGSSTNKEVDVVVTRRMSGRSGEKEAAASRKTIGRPPKRKAAMIVGRTPDSVKGGRSGRDGSEKGKKKPRR